MIEQTDNSFINAFSKKLEGTVNKEYLIQNEITQIERTVCSDDNLHEHNDEPWLGVEVYSVFKLQQQGSLVLFNSIFHHYLTHKEYNSLLGKGMVEDESIMSTVREAVGLADYYTWLKSLLNSPNKNKPNSSLSHKQKMLALHYLGLDMSKYDNTTSGNILGEILGLDKGNTRKYLSYVAAGKNDVRTKKNLQVVLNLFESQNLMAISSKINEDMESLS